jgi:hypothetical protein
MLRILPQGIEPQGGLCTWLRHSSPWLVSQVMLQLLLRRRRSMALLTLWLQWRLRLCWLMGSWLLHCLRLPLLLPAVCFWVWNGAMGRLPLCLLLLIRCCRVVRRMPEVWLRGPGLLG